MATATGSYATTSTVKSRAGITDATDDTELGLIVDQVNMYIESTTGRVLAPISGTPTRYYDIDESSNTLYIPEGIRSVTTLYIAAYTDADYTLIAAGDYYLRPLRPMPGWPYTEIRLSDRPAGSYSEYPVGYETVKVTGLFGWAAIPDDVAEVAVTIAIRAWAARQAGQSDIVGTDEFGRPIISRYVSGRDRDTLRRYAIVDALY